MLYTMKNGMVLVLSKVQLVSIRDDGVGAIVLDSGNVVEVPAIEVRELIVALEGLFGRKH